MPRQRFVTHWPSLKQKRKRLKQYIHLLASNYPKCPVEYNWHDQGERYWPRWIRLGRCVNLGGYSCSIPPGLYCQGAKIIEYQNALGTGFNDRY
ncbi:unnamed protein product [Dicrocoelium dendriticum]|nr:unnamed protein product [Dicrocoelium dendriticum]